MKFKNNLFLAVLSLSLLIGCGDKNYYYECVPSTSDTIGITVTNIPTQILSFQEVKELKPGTMLRLRLNRTGSVVTEYTVRFDGTYDMNGERLILCTTSHALVVGQGDSGSPLLTADGEVIGALCYGFDFSNYQFAARAIEDMLTIDTTKVPQNTVKGKSNFFKDLGIVQYAIGFDEKCLERYSLESTPFNRFNSDNTNFLENQPTSLKSAPASSNAIIPGNSIGINLIYGDLYAMGTIGTLSHITEKNKYLAFGHKSGSNYRPIRPRTTLANMITMINSTLIAYKLAVPTNHTVGSMISDMDNGILIDPQATAQEFNHQMIINMTGKLADDLGEQISANHTIANFHNTYDEIYFAAVIPAATVYNQIILKGHSALQATCTFDVMFKNSQAYTNTFLISSPDGFDAYLFYRLRTEIYNFFNGGEIENITDYKITLDISDYDYYSEY